MNNLFKKKQLGDRKHPVKIRNMPNERKRQYKRDYLELLRTGQTAVIVKDPSIYLNSSEKNHA